MCFRVLSHQCDVEGFQVRKIRWRIVLPHCVRPERCQAGWHSIKPALIVNHRLSLCGTPFAKEFSGILHATFVEPAQPTVWIAILPVPLPDRATNRGPFVVPNRGDLFLVLQQRNVRAVHARTNKRAAFPLQRDRRLEFLEVLALRQPLNYTLTPES